MGTRAETSGLDDEEIVELAKAIGHRTRLDAIRDLRREGETSPSRFSRAHKVNLGTATHHFDVLRGAGIAKVIRTERGRNAEGSIYALEGPRTRMTLAMLDLLEGRVEIDGKSVARDGRRA